ncbi:MAG: OadG family protein [bacterium]|nr:OadG family protein [bacterium]
MDINDALTITVLGISVVFAGLLLTSLMIHSFSLIPKLSGLLVRRREKKKEAVAAMETKDAAEIKPIGPVEPELLAVITAVLEVEWRLRASLLEGKFTFK